MSFSFIACGEKENTSPEYKHDVDVAKYASMGRIPEIDITLGDAVSDIKETLLKIGTGKTFEEYKSELLESGFKGTDEDIYNTVIIKSETAGYTVLSTIYNTNESVYCLYNTESENPTVNAIAVMGKAYGYDANTLKKFVENTVDGAKKEITEDSKINFLPKVSAGGSGFTYNFNVFDVEFYFSQYDTLAATVIYDTRT